MEWVVGLPLEASAKPPFLPDFCACPVECEAYSSRVRLKF